MNELILNSTAKTEKINFVFHGYGANKENLLSVGKAFARSIDNAEVHLPDGIETCDEGSGYQWFPFTVNDINEWKKAFYANEATLEYYISNIIEKKGFCSKNVILTGFSQGGMISLLLGLKLGVKAVVAFSSILIDPDVTITSPETKILMTHGTADSVLPISLMNASEQVLKNRGIDVRTIICENTAHGIDDQALRGAIDFIKD